MGAMEQHANRLQSISPSSHVVHENKLNALTYDWRRYKGVCTGPLWWIWLRLPSQSEVVRR